MPADAKEINAAIAEINAVAHTARRLCNDIIRQTSLKPYYGKRGAAAVYAADCLSEAQHKAITEAVQHLYAATELLIDVAIEGGTAEAFMREVTKNDCGQWQTVETPDGNSDGKRIANGGKKNLLLIPKRQHYRNRKADA